MGRKRREYESRVWESRRSRWKPILTGPRGSRGPGEGMLDWNGVTEPTRDVYGAPAACKSLPRASGRGARIKD